MEDSNKIATVKKIGQMYLSLLNAQLQIEKDQIERAIQELRKKLNAELEESTIKFLDEAEKRMREELSLAETHKDDNFFYNRYKKSIMKQYEIAINGFIEILSHGRNRI